MGLSSLSRLSKDKAEIIVRELLRPTPEGIKVVEREIDTDHSGFVDKMEAWQWWLQHCSRDLCAFERTWLIADEDCSNDLQASEIKTLLYGKEVARSGAETRRTSIRDRLREQDFLTSQSPLIHSDDNYKTRDNPTLNVDADTDSRGTYAVRVHVQEGRNLAGMDRGGTPPWELLR